MMHNVVDQQDHAPTQGPDKDLAAGLPAGAMLLQGQYEVQARLAVGGFGMTYLARDSLTRQVVVKECFPDGLCVREGLLVMPVSDEQQGTYQKIVWNFVAEARRLARLKHPNVVAVHQVFEENHTAYMAMDLVDGEELIDVFETTPGRLTPELLRHCLRQALDAVQHLHETGILHRDISPDNLLLDRDNHLTLIDFGAARENAQQSITASTYLLAVKDGYSPYEFYVENAVQDASSDLYSLAATFYHLITGDSPPDSWTRHEEVEAGRDDPYLPLKGGDWAFERGFLELIDRALSLVKEDRLQTAEEWLDLLEAGAAPEPEPVPVVAEQQPLAAPPTRARKPLPKVAEVDLNALSKLVQDTNTVVATGPAPVASRDKAPTAEKAKAPGGAPAAGRAVKETQQMVDIYGDPVEDLDAWMQEQERVLKAKAKMEAVRPPETGEERDPQPKSLLVRLLTGALLRSRSSAGMVKIRKEQA